MIDAVSVLASHPGVGIWHGALPVPADDAEQAIGIEHTKGLLDAGLYDQPEHKA